MVLGGLERGCPSLVSPLIHPSYDTTIRADARCHQGDTIMMSICHHIHPPQKPHHPSIKNIDFACYPQFSYSLSTLNTGFCCHALISSLLKAYSDPNSHSESHRLFTPCGLISRIQPLDSGLDSGVTPYFVRLSGDKMTQI